MMAVLRVSNFLKSAQTVITIYTLTDNSATLPIQRQLLLVQYKQQANPLL
jgi:hypothetical protein